MRLARFGYKMGMITCPTLEDSPDTLPTWIRQRTRWFKGWMQTYLVHVRNPISTFRELEFSSFIVFQILLFGIVISSMSYALIAIVVAAILYKYANLGTLSDFEIALLAIDTANVTLGLSAFLLLGWKTLHPSERSGFWRIALTTPLYWFIMSIASWRAAWQLYRCPFLWEKTPHRRSDAAHSATA